MERFVRGRQPGEARKLDFMPWGGAYNRVPRGRHGVPPPTRSSSCLRRLRRRPGAGSDAATTECLGGAEGLPGRWGNAVASAGHAVVGAAPGREVKTAAPPGAGVPGRSAPPCASTARAGGGARGNPEPQVRAAVLVLTRIAPPVSAESRQRGGPRAPRRRGPRQQPTRTGRAAPRLRSRCPIMEPNRWTTGSAPASPPTVTSRLAASCVGARRRPLLPGGEQRHCAP